MVYTSSPFAQGKINAWSSDWNEEVTNLNSALEELNYFKMLCKGKLHNLSPNATGYFNILSLLGHRWNSLLFDLVRLCSPGFLISFPVCTFSFPPISICFNIIYLIRAHNLQLLATGNGALMFRSVTSICLFMSRRGPYLQIKKLQSSTF